MVTNKGGLPVAAGNQHDRETDDMLPTIKIPIPVQKVGTESSKESALLQ